MNTKKGILILVLSLVISITYAQKKEKNRGPGHFPNEEQLVKLADHLSEKLSLSNEQYQKIRKLCKDHAKEIADQHSEAHKKHMQKMETLRVDFETKIKTELTEEQKELFTEQMARRSRKIKRGPGLD